MREHRGARRIGARRPWITREIRLLGRFNDLEVARRLARTKKEVWHQRQALKIPPLKPRPPFKAWTRPEERLLGKFPDDVLAKRLGRTPTAIRNRRAILGIPQLNPKYRVFIPAEDAILGTAPDKEIAARLSRDWTTIKSRRLRLGIKRQRLWTKREDGILGTMPDKEAAKKLGRTLAATRFRRELLGKPPCNPIWNPWTAAHRKLLGNLSIREFAQKNRTSRTFRAAHSVAFGNSAGESSPSTVDGRGMGVAREDSRSGIRSSIQTLSRCGSSVSLPATITQRCSRATAVDPE